MRYVAGHVDFYGYHEGANGWFIGGWSDGWSTRDWPAAMAAHFSNGEVRDDDYLATLYPRDDLGDRGVGFVIFVRGEAAFAGFERLAIGWDDQTAEIIPWPPPPVLHGRDLVAALMPALRHRAAGPDPYPLLRLAVPEYDRDLSERRLKDLPAPPAALVHRAEDVFEAVFATPFVDDALCRQNLGARKGNIDAAILYLQLPAPARPKIV